MTCYLHSDRDALATCGACRRTICQECDVLLGGSHFCKQCLAEAPTVSEFEPQRAQSVTQEERSQTLVRSTENRVVFGVIGGISQYFRVEAAILRFIYGAILLGIPLFWMLYTRMPGYSRDGWTRADQEWEIYLGWTSILLPLVAYLLAAMTIPAERKTAVPRRSTLMRSRKDPVFRGVLGGYGERFGIDSATIRICFVFLLFLPLLMGVFFPIGMDRDMYASLSILVPLLLIGFYLVNALILPVERRPNGSDNEQA